MPTSDVRKAVTGASIGNAVEWFDFAIYGFLATFIAANFFPSGNETAALLNIFAIGGRAVYLAEFASDKRRGLTVTFMVWSGFAAWVYSRAFRCVLATLVGGRR